VLDYPDEHISSDIVKPLQRVMNSARDTSRLSELVSSVVGSLW